MLMVSLPALKGQLVVSNVPYLLKSFGTKRNSPMMITTLK